MKSTSALPPSPTHTKEGRKEGREGRRDRGRKEGRQADRQEGTAGLLRIILGF